MEADHRAPVCESGEVLADARPETVWDTISDLESWPRWMAGVKAMRVDGTLGVGTAFEWKAGPGTIRSQVLECDRPRSIGWKGRTFGISALHVWRMAPEDGGTRVFTEESWSGPLARLLPGLMHKTVRRALDNGLAELKAEAERRDPPTS